MFKKNCMKKFLCMFVTFLMVFSTLDTSILGMKQVYAKTEESENKLKDEIKEKNTKEITEEASKKEVKKEEASKKEVKKEEASKKEVKKEEASKKEVKKEEASKEEVKKEEASKEEVKKEEASKEEVNEAIRKAHSYVQNNSTYSSDWKTVAFNKSGLSLKEDYNEDYLKGVEKRLKDCKGYFYKVTDYERMTLGVAAAGGEPRNIGGYNLLEKIYNFSDGDKKLDFQGLNGIIYGLMALDSKRYEVPKDAKYTREYMLDYILDNRDSDGGWDLSMNGKKSDVDMTSMTLISLAPYHDYVSSNGKKVKDAVDEAVAWLSKAQIKQGGFKSWFTENNSESCAQAIIGLCANGVDPTSKEFTKDINLMQNLLKFQKTEGGFSHLRDSDVDGMATEQAYQAIIAYRDFIQSGRKYCNGKNSIYCFGESSGEIIKKDDKDTENPTLEVTGLENGKEVSNKNISFEVKVTDNVDKNLKENVKLNGEVVTKSNGKYEVELNLGENVITIEVTDAAGNKVDETYNITRKSNINTISIESDLSELKCGHEQEIKVCDNQGNEVPLDDLEVLVEGEGKGTVKNEGKKTYFKALKEGKCKVTLALKENKDIKGTKEFTVKENSKTIYIRIEGYDHTLLERTKIKVPLYDISKDLGSASGSSATKSDGWGPEHFTNPTNAHAIVYALKNKLNMTQQTEEEKKNGKDAADTFDFQDYGWNLYIAMIGGDRERQHGFISGWMYRVNDEMANVGCASKDLEDGDDVVWYYGANGFENSYSKLTCNENKVYLGEKINLKASEVSADSSEELKGLEGATVLVDGKEYKQDNKTVKTNKNGEACIQLNTLGKHKISLTKTENDAISIVRPVPLEIEVLENKNKEFFIKVQNLNQDKIFKKDSSGEAKFSIQNTSKEDKNVTLAVVLYDKNTNEMINYSYVKKNLKAGSKEEFAGGFMIPKEGEFQVKAIICDDLNTENMNVLVDPITMKVE